MPSKVLRVLHRESRQPPLLCSIDLPLQNSIIAVMENGRTSRWVNPIATLEQIPSQEFHLTATDDKTKEAIAKLRANPEKYDALEFFALHSGQLIVQMIEVTIDNQTINLDRRTGLGKIVFEQFMKEESD